MAVQCTQPNIICIYHMKSTQPYFNATGIHAWQPVTLSLASCYELRPSLKTMVHCSQPFMDKGNNISSHALLLLHSPYPALQGPLTATHPVLSTQLPILYLQMDVMGRHIRSCICCSPYTSINYLSSHQSVVNIQRPVCTLT